MNFISENIIYLFFIFALMQIFIPVLAFKIKQRFNKLDIEMKSAPLSALIQQSKFWKEARVLNAKTNDPIIRLYLCVYYIPLAAIISYIIIITITFLA